MPDVNIEPSDSGDHLEAPQSPVAEPLAAPHPATPPVLPPPQPAAAEAQGGPQPATHGGPEALPPLAPEAQGEPQPGGPAARPDAESKGRDAEAIVKKEARKDGNSSMDVDLNLGSVLLTLIGFNPDDVHPPRTPPPLPPHTQTQHRRRAH